MAGHQVNPVGEGEECPGGLGHKTLMEQSRSAGEKSPADGVAHEEGGFMDLQLAPEIHAMRLDRLDAQAQGVCGGDMGRHMRRIVGSRTVTRVFLSRKASAPPSSAALR
jgi:hypothetical protein